MYPHMSTFTFITGSSSGDLNVEEGDDSSYPLAVKMMFNYDAESNAMSILRAMHRETVPAMSYSSNDEIMSWEDRYYYISWTYQCFFV